jgi:hypothetical protein
LIRPNPGEFFFMFRPRKEPDPLKDKRRRLAERERLLAERMSQLNDKLARGGEEAPKRHEPPVWRLEEDAPVITPRIEPTAARRRVLARQRRNDQILFFVMIIALIVVTLLVLALAHSHGQGALPAS